MLRRASVLALVVAAVAAIAQGPPASGRIAIVGAKIELGTGESIPAGVVVVEGGRIVSVSPGTQAPAGATVVNAAGKTLYPGFIDGFSTRGLKAPSDPPAQTRPNTGLTAPPTMWIANRKGITPEYMAATNVELGSQASAYQQGLTGSILCGSRGSMRGTAAAVDLIEGGKDAVIRANAGLGFSFRSAGGAGYPGNILGVIALMRQTLADAKSLNDGAELYPPTDPKPAWMASLEALQPAITRLVPVFWEANLEREVGRAITLSEEFGLELIIQGGRDTGPWADQLAKAKIPVVLTADLGIEPSLTGTDGTPPGLRKERNDRWQMQSKNAELLAQAGVPFLFSSDGGFSSFLENVRRRISRGLPREAALKALTSTAADVLGLHGEIGRIAPGLRANLVLMDGDFADSNTKVTAVWIQGRPVFPATPEVKS